MRYVCLFCMSECVFVDFTGNTRFEGTESMKILVLSVEKLVVTHEPKSQCFDPKLHAN